MKIRLFLLLFLVTPLLQAEIFKWVDQEGNVHFSDQNLNGSTPVELRPATVIETPTDPPSAQRQENSPQAKAPAGPAYESVRILKPADDESIRSSGEDPINVMIESSPGLADGDSYRLSMNGQVVASDLSSGLVPLENVERGSHTLMVEIVGKSGNSLISSEEISFHVLRVANAPRPTPR
jgi:hypothetical protein